MCSHHVHVIYEVPVVEIIHLSFILAWALWKLRKKALDRATTIRGATHNRREAPLGMLYPSTSIWQFVSNYKTFQLTVSIQDRREFEVATFRLSNLVYWYLDNDLFLSE